MRLHRLVRLLPVFVSGILAPAAWLPAQTQMSFQPAGPVTLTTPSLTVVADLCDHLYTLDPLDVSATWNGGGASTSFSTSPACPGDVGKMRMTFSLTATAGDNNLVITAMNENGDFFTDISNYFYGALVAERTTGAMRANGGGVFTFHVQNNSGVLQNYSFESGCTPAGVISSCSVTPGTLTIPASTTDSVRLSATTGSAGQSGTIFLKPRILVGGIWETADSSEVAVTLITPTMSVTPTQPSYATYPGVARTKSFTVSSSAGAVGATVYPICPAGWNCLLPGGSGITTPATVNVQFTPQGVSTESIYLVAYRPGTPADRDSSAMVVTMLAPNVTGTAQGGSSQVKPAGSGQTLLFDAGASTGQSFNVTVTCTGSLTGKCGTPNPASIVLGAGTIQVPYTTGAYGNGANPGTITVTLTQASEPGNTASIATVITPTTSATFSPSSIGASASPGVPGTQAVTLLGLAASTQAQTFDLTVTSCTGLTGCGISPTQVTNIWTGNSGAATASFTLPTGGTSGTMVVKAAESGSPGNFTTVTINVSSAPQLTLTPTSGAIRSAYRNAPDTASWNVGWTGATQTASFIQLCSAELTGCSTPGNVTIPTGTPVTMTYQVGTLNGKAGLKITSGTALDTDSITVLAVAPKVTVLTSTLRTLDSLQVATASATQQFTFQVRNDTTYTTSYSHAVASDGLKVTGCSTPANSTNIAPSASATVVVTCATTIGATGWVRLTSKQTTKFGNTANAQWNAIIGTYAVAVTPDNATAIQVPAGAGQTQLFTVTNTGTLPAQFDLATACTGSVTACTPSTSSVTLFPSGQGTSSAAITVTYNSGAAGGTGNVRLSATAHARTETDLGTQAISASAAANVVATMSMENYRDYQPARCEAGCFAVRPALTTVPYTSLDTPRSLTLAYNSDAVSPRPFIHVDVKLQNAPASTLQEYWLEAKDSTGAFITFLNGDTRLRFTAPATPTTTTVRLSGQFDATAYATGVYPVTVLVSAVHAAPTPTETKTISTKFLVINERKSPFGRGWNVAGWSRLKVMGTDALIVDGSGAATYFTGCGTGCYTSPTTDFSRLRTTGAGASLVYRREFPDSSRAEYDNTGNLRRMIDRTTLDTVEFVYDANNRLNQVKDPFRASGGAHLYWEIQYNAAGLATGIVEPGPNNTFIGGRRTILTVNATDSTLRQWTNPTNVFTLMRYDASLRLMQLINARADTTRFLYHAASWKLDSIISPRFRKFPDAAAADTVSLRTSFRSWELASLPTTSTTVTAAIPAKADTIRAITKAPGGQVTAFSVDALGQPLVITHLPGVPQLQRTTTITRYPSGLPQNVQQHSGAVDSFQYSTSGMPTVVQLAGQPATNTAYGAFNQVTQVSGTGQPTQVFVLGTRGRVDTAKVVATTTYATAYTYDTRGRVQSVVVPGGATTSYTYDATFGNMKTTTVPGGRVTTKTFDGVGRDSLVDAPLMARRVMVYDSLNRLLTDSVAAGTGAAASKSTYVYGDKVNLTRLTDGAGNLYRWGYNGLGNVTVDTMPNGGMTRRSFYDAQGRMIVARNELVGDSVITSYDLLHRPLQVVTKRGATIRGTSTFGYAPDGWSWVAASNAVSRDTTYLSQSGWVDSVVTRLETDWTKRVVRRYIKDANARLDSVHVVYPGTIAATGRKYVWNTGTGALSEARVSGAGPAIANVDADVSFDRITWPGAGAVNYAQTTQSAPYRADYATSALDASFLRLYNYDAAGRVDIQYAINGLNVAQRNFAYDVRGRLVSVHDSTALASLCEGTPNVDDGATLCNAGVPHVFNARDSVTYSAVGNPVYVNGWPTPIFSVNRLTSWPRSAAASNTYTVDSAGFRTSRANGNPQTTYYRWTPEGLLDSVVVGPLATPSRVIRYEYNAYGQLVRRSVNGVKDRHFFWDRDNLLAELDGALAARRSEYAHFPGLDQPFAMLTGATTVTTRRYIQRDPLGNVIGLTRDDGTVDTDQLGTTQWGVPTASGVAVADTMRLRWNGLMYEADSTGLYYVRARWYDPQTRSFLSEDPTGLGGGWNPYVYADGDPINRVDAEGTEWECKDKWTWVSNGVDSKTEWFTKCDWKDEPLPPSPGGPSAPIQIAANSGGSGAATTAQGPSCSALWKGLGKDALIDLAFGGAGRWAGSRVAKAAASKFREFPLVFRGTLARIPRNQGAWRNRMRVAEAWHAGVGLAGTAATAKAGLDEQYLTAGVGIVVTALAPEAYFLPLVVDLGINGFQIIKAGCADFPFRR